MEENKTERACVRPPEPITVEDAELVERVRSGDREAYGRLVDHYQALIFNRCLQMTGNTPDAEELAHQTFVQGYIKLDQLRDPGKFLPWLRTLCLNVCRMWYRERKRRPVSLSDEEPTPVESWNEEPVERTQLGWALAKLSEAHRVILVLRYFEGLSYDEISRFLDVPLGTTMSRIHRAHYALKEIMKNPRDEAEMDTLTSREDFRREVEAEIAVLLEMSGADRSAMERLAIILRRSPDRLAQLLVEAPAPSTVGNVALLLPHLGGAAIDTVLGLSLSSDTAQSAAATATLEQAVAHCRLPFPCSSTPGGMASQQMYVLVDRLIAMVAPAEAKAALLADMMDSAESDGAATLLSVALLCYLEPAFEILEKRFWSARNTDVPYDSPDTLYTLCRTGTRFCAALVERLRGGVPADIAPALEGAKAIGRALEMGDMHRGALPQHIADSVRSRRKWAPLIREQLDAAVFANLIEAIGAFVNDSLAEVRESALGAVRKLKASQLRPLVEKCATHPDVSTRCAAILALGDLGDLASADLLMGAARGHDPRERLAAVQALARLRVSEAAPLLESLIDDTHGEVRCAAVYALNDVAGESATDTLKGLLHSNDMAIRKAAAKALHGTKRTGRTPTPLELERRERAGTGGAAFTYRSLDATIRFAVPEIRAYTHQDITQRMSQVCADFSTARRHLVTEGLIERENDIYELTPLGETVWRVEHFILDNYLGTGLLASVTR